MSVVLLLLGGLLVVCGAVACVIPVLPGPIVSFCGLLCLSATERSPSLSVLVVYATLTAVATVLDFAVPAIGARRFKCSRWGLWGCAVGTLAGAFFFPIGLLLGPFLGAFVGELLAGRAVRTAAWGGLGAFLGFVSGVMVKLAVCLAMLVCYIRCL